MPSGRRSLACPAGGDAVDVVVLSETSSREDLTAALAEFTDRAKACHPSPRWDELHETIDEILTWLVGR